MKYGKQGYVPEVGDVVWVEFSPQAAREQAGRRPALVLSRRIYNEKASLALMCPLTSQVKGYPFEVAVPPGSRFRGVILADQIKSLDWQKRKAQRAGRIPPEVLDQVWKRIATLIGLSV
ncbi:MAG TPA: endoribonuclease MazF [Candidatus Acidoferrum sp.]